MGVDVSLSDNLKNVDEGYAFPVCVLVSIYSVAKVEEIRESRDIPILRNQTDFGLFVARRNDRCVNDASSDFRLCGIRAHAHTNPIRLRWSSNLVLSVATSRSSSGSRWT